MATRTISQLQTLTHMCHKQQQSSRIHQPGQLANHKHWFTCATTNNSPQDYTNPADQQTTNIDSPGSQATSVLATTPTLTIHQLQTLTHLGCNQQQPFSGLHQHGRSISYKHWVTCVTTNNSPHNYANPNDQPTTNIDSPGSQPTTLSPSQDYTNPDHQSTTNTDSPGLQPTTALLRNTATRTISQLQTLTHLGHNQH